MTIFGKKLKTSNNDVISAYEYRLMMTFTLTRASFFPRGLWLVLTNERAWIVTNQRAVLCPPPHYPLVAGDA